LESISNIELRETVHAATCKSEEFNQFVQWVFFFNHGVIRENLRFAQEKMVSFNHLVANLVILHNVDTMSKAIRKLRREAMVIPDEALRRLSPAVSTSIYWGNTPSISLIMCCDNTLNWAE
jgi:TnpA family transposase